MATSHDTHGLFLCPPGFSYLEQSRAHDLLQETFPHQRQHRVAHNLRCHLATHTHTHTHRSKVMEWTFPGHTKPTSHLRRASSPAALSCRSPRLAQISWVLVRCQQSQVKGSATRPQSNLSCSAGLNREHSDLWPAPKANIRTGETPKAKYKNWWDPWGKTQNLWDP